MRKPACRDYRELRPQAIASLSARARFELASKDSDALAHPDEAVAAAITAPGTPSVVAHRYLEISVAVVDDHLSAPRACVLESVRKAFLHKPVPGEIDPGRERPRIAFDSQLDG